MDKSRRRRIVIRAVDGGGRAAAADLARALDLPHRDTVGADEGSLEVGESGVAFRLPGAPSAVRVDFVAGAQGHRRRSGGRDGIVHALGIRRGIGHVLDCGAGLGRDAFTLAAAGATVCAVERDPVVAALVRDGLRRAAEDPECADIAARIELIAAEASVVLDAIESGTRARPDAVYLDPMFPPRTKSASVKMDAAALQWLVHGSVEDPAPATDAGDLLARARGVARRRVVVKRPRRAPPLEPGPIGDVAGRAVRWDIYTVQDPEEPGKYGDRIGPPSDNDCSS